MKERKFLERRELLESRRSFFKNNIYIYIFENLKNSSVEREREINYYYYYRKYRNVKIRRSLESNKTGRP